jgi:hypothetical protein
MCEFELFLTNLCSELTSEVKILRPTNATDFERIIRKSINRKNGFKGEKVSEEAKVQEFPDIPIGAYGIEVKFTENDTWRSIANSVSEGSRNSNVEEIYIIFGKMGGSREVRWGKYEKVVMHVRTSHVPRFEIDMTSKEPLFEKIGINYVDFRKLDMHDKMKYIRAYARNRLQKGERLWWVEDNEKETKHSLPLEVKLYTHLTQKEKRKLRAEGALLSPKVVSGSRVKNKYDDVVMYILTRYGILCPQARDLFSAGSVALRASDERGGNYLLRAMKDIENEMINAANSLPDELFVEYWGHAYPVDQRINEWLKKADEFAVDWKPSKVLFQNQ